MESKTEKKIKEYELKYNIIFNEYEKSLSQCDIDYEKGLITLDESFAGKMGLIFKECEKRNVDFTKIYSQALKNK